MKSEIIEIKLKIELLEDVPPFGHFLLQTQKNLKNPKKHKTGFLRFDYTIECDNSGY
jgi:hypothetical protein